MVCSPAQRSAAFQIGGVKHKYAQFQAPYSGDFLFHKTEGRRTRIERQFVAATTSSPQAGIAELFQTAISIQNIAIIRYLIRGFIDGIRTLKN